MNYVCLRQASDAVTSTCKRSKRAMGGLRRGLSSVTKTMHWRRRSTWPSGLGNIVYGSACWRKPIPYELSALQIEAYFQQLRELIDACPSVQSHSLTYDKRGTHEGFVRGEITFVD